jgi:hypothetical protein
LLTPTKKATPGPGTENDSLQFGQGRFDLPLRFGVLSDLYLLGRFKFLDHQGIIQRGKAALSPYTIFKGAF